MTTTSTDVFERVRYEFRTDLFYRLNIIHLVIPALRDRPEDIPILFQHYLSYYAKGNIPRLSPGPWKQLVEYAWPGNVQELKAVAEGLSRHDLPRLVEPEDLPSNLPVTSTKGVHMLDRVMTPAAQPEAAAAESTFAPPRPAGLRASSLRRPRVSSRSDRVCPPCAGRRLSSSGPPAPV